MQLVSKAKLLVEEPFGKCSLLSMCLYSQTKVLTRTQMHLRPSRAYQLDSLLCESLTSSGDLAIPLHFPASSWLVTAASSVGFWGFLGPATWRGTPAEQQQKRPGYWSKSRAGWCPVSLVTPYEMGHSGKTKQKALFYETLRRNVDS